MSPFAEPVFGAVGASVLILWNWEMNAFWLAAAGNAKTARAMSVDDERAIDLPANLVTAHLSLAGRDACSASELYTRGLRQRPILPGRGKVLGLL